MSLPSRLLGANPSIQVSTLLSGTLTTPSARQAFVSPAFESIASANGTGSSGTVTFSGIPSTFQHLQIRILGRSSSTGREALIRFNADTGSNYAEHNLRGNGATAAAVGEASKTSIASAYVATSGAATDTMGVSIIDIHDYASTTKNKTLRALSGLSDNNLQTTNERIYLFSGLWMDTDAIDSISIASNSGNWTTSSVFALYGIRGA